MTAFTRRWIYLALVYFVAGISLGLHMGITGNHALGGVHAHINLLGWVSLALTGLIYQQFPRAAATTLAQVHFWMYNLGLPLMMIGLRDKLLGHHALEPLLAGGSLLIGLAVLLFAVNIGWRRG